jgi:TPR repeat protein
MKDQAMNHLHSLVLAITLLVGGVSVATAEDLNKGFEAAQSGDLETALQEWRPLAEHGNASAQFILGVAYRNGEGVPQDDAEAVKWYRLAAEQGLDDGQRQLGWMYDGGRGVPQDRSEAMKWYRLAAKQGDGLAQVYLGMMYDRGHGVLQSKIMAHMWYNIGAANGSELVREHGIAERDFLAKQMASADISTAQAMARECMSSNYQNCGE